MAGAMEEIWSGGRNGGDLVGWVAAGFGGSVGVGAFQGPVLSSAFRQQFWPSGKARLLD